MHIYYPHILLLAVSLTPGNGNQDPREGQNVGGTELPATSAIASHSAISVPVSKCCPVGVLLTLPGYSCLRQPDNIETIFVKLQGLDLSDETKPRSAGLTLVSSGEVGKPNCTKSQTHLIKIGKLAKQ